MLPPLPQKPVTFFRQVLSLCEYRELLDHPLAAEIYPTDAIEVCVPTAAAERQLQLAWLLGLSSRRRGRPRGKQASPALLTFARTSLNPRGPCSAPATTWKTFRGG